MNQLYYEIDGSLRSITCLSPGSVPLKFPLWIPCLCVTGWELGPEWVGLGPADNVWVLDFVQERFHNTSPGDFWGMFIKAGDSETKEGDRVEEETGDSLGGALLWIPRNIIGQKWARAEPLLAHWKIKASVTEVSQGGVALAHWKVREKCGLRDRSRSKPWRNYHAHCSPSFKSHGDP